MAHCGLCDAPEQPALEAAAAVTAHHHQVDSLQVLRCELVGTDRAGGTHPSEHSGDGLSDLLGSVKLGLDVYRLDQEQRWRLLQFFIGAPESIIERWFESDKVKSMIAAG